MVSALFLVLLAGLLYALIPDLILHRLGIGSRKRQYTAGVALTFDDGPNPDITPQILDILDRYQVSATFFVVGERAALYPDIVQQIKTRGHQIGAHSQHHSFAWFMSPWKTWREWNECIATIERLAGEKVNYIRPPWGTFNFVLWIWLKLHNKKVVLWDVEGRDWRVSFTPDKIVSRVVARVQEGSIVVLHDAGGEAGAPNNTLHALEHICQHIRNDLKLPLVKLELPEWSLWRRITFTLWGKWERFFAWRHHVERISSTNIFRLSKSRYKGPELYSEDGFLLAQKGDLVGEIHIDSIRLMGKETGIQEIAVRTLHQAKASMSELARFIADNPDYANLKVFIGLTLLNRGVKGLGFRVQEIPRTFFSRSVGFLQKIIMYIYHPIDKRLIRKHLTGQPKIVWISREQMLEKWFREIK